MDHLLSPAQPNIAAATTVAPNPKPALPPKPVVSPPELERAKEKAPAIFPPSERLMSLDAYRGLIMLFMASSGFGLTQVARAIEKTTPNTWWRYLAYQVEHVPWVTGTTGQLFWGLTLWDLIQPAFMFMVGVAMPYSYAKRQSRGDSYWSLLRHAVVRSVILVLLGVYLSSNWDSQTNWAFMNVLSQIGLGYTFVFLLMNRHQAVQWFAFVAVLVGMWYAYYQYTPPPPTDYAKFGIGEKELANGVILEGFGHPWSKGINFGAAQDRTFLNLFPRKEPFVFNNGGYQTLNFVTSIATMLLGLIVGEMLRKDLAPRQRMLWLGICGGVLLVLGIVLGLTISPNIKRIWSPSWTLYSGGLVVWMLAALYWIIDVRGWRKWCWFLVVVGMNSIAMYFMSQLARSYTRDTLQRHLGLPYEWLTTWLNAHLHLGWPAELFGGVYGPLFEKLSILFIFWLVCVWLYRQKIFIRI